MKTNKIFQKLWIGAAGVALLMSAVSCEKDRNDDPPVNADEQYQAIVNEYVKTTIIPTYKALAEAALEMRRANEALKANPSDETMKAASDAWMKARVAWEVSEAYLFGPVGEHALNIDAHIDSWPLEKSAIDEVLANDAAGLTGEKAWRDMDDEVIGFHVTEYLLYRDGKARPVKDMTTAELKYLTAATDALVWDCVLAYVAWVGESNVSSEMKAVFRENQDVVAHLTANSYYINFGEKLMTAEGYASIGAAMAEIATGAVEIAGEVGSSKIEAPYAAGKVEDVESWYSWHSLDDYQNNIHSIKNAYLGGTSNATRKANCFSAFVASKDAQLDADIKAKIEECLSKIKAIGAGGKSFYEVVRDKKNGSSAMDATVDAAVTACLELRDLFDTAGGLI